MLCGARLAAARARPGASRPVWQLCIGRGYSELSHSESNNIPAEFCVDGVPSKALKRVGLLSTNAPVATTLDQLLDSINHKKDDIHRPGSVTQPAWLHILVTPAFAKHAFDPQFPTRVLDRLDGKFTNRIGLLSWVAVVDRLPAPDAGDYGTEGIAYSYCSQGRHNARLLHQTEQTTTAQHPGFINFTEPEQTIELPGSTSTCRKHEIQLPLANTIFSTGRISTLDFAAYSLDSNGKLQQRDSRPLESMSLIFPRSTVRMDCDVHCPLVPLTPFRTIDNCMGNIIRALRPAPFQDLPDAPSDPQPASQELEAAVSAYFEAHEMTPEPVNVWALTLPAEQIPNHRAMGILRHLTQAEIQRSWLQQPEKGLSFNGMQKVIDRSIRQILGSDFRLCRVLSGGGGWGKKAGLLSLDPDDRYSTRDLRRDEGWNFSFEEEETEKQQKQALGEIVKQGEQVMFFLAPKKEKEGELLRKEYAQTSADAAHVFRLGVLPSSVDAVSQPSEDASHGGRAAQIKHWRNLYGGLSEGGLALTVEGNDDCFTQTKLDVPFSMFTLRTPAKKSAEIRRKEDNVQEDPAPPNDKAVKHQSQKSFRRVTHEATPPESKPNQSRNNPQSHASGPMGPRVYAQNIFARNTRFTDPHSPVRLQASYIPRRREVLSGEAGDEAVRRTLAPPPHWLEFRRADKRKSIARRLDAALAEGRQLRREVLDRLGRDVRRDHALWEFELQKGSDEAWQEALQMLDHEDGVGPQRETAGTEKL